MWTQKSFNSQRDEILLYASSMLKVDRCVSIPNGMKFYLDQYRESHNSQYSFNSQRDEILRIFSPFLSMIKSIVSIPNGMKFYEVFSTHEAQYKTCFNSQRDEILQHEFSHFPR